MTQLDVILHDSQIAIEAWGDERTKLIVQQLMRVPDGSPPPTAAEVDLYASRCLATGLDPLGNQIHAVYRSDKRSPLGRTLSMQVGIDGFWLVAQRTGQQDGESPTTWQDRDGTWLDTWPRDYPPVAARAIVHRKDAAHPFYGVAMFAEYVQTYLDHGTVRPTKMWATKPARMLAKCAEAQALRKAFPADLSGVYEPAELDQLDPTMPPERAEAKAAEADERRQRERVTRGQADEITRHARAALLTRGEVRGVLEDVAHVGRIEHVLQRDYQAVLDAIDRKARPAAAPGATVGEPEVVATGAPVDADDEPVEPEADADDEPGRSSSAGNDEPEATPAQRVDEPAAAPRAARGGGGGEAGDAPDLSATAERSAGGSPSPTSLLDSDEPLADAVHGPGAYGPGAP